MASLGLSFRIHLKDKQSYASQRVLQADFSKNSQILRLPSTGIMGASAEFKKYPNGKPQDLLPISKIKALGVDRQLPEFSSPHW